jgi:hypothetical protein
VVKQKYFQERKSTRQIAEELGIGKSTVWYKIQRIKQGKPELHQPQAYYNPNIPLTIATNILDPQWVVGFTDGEGCFHFAVYKRYRNGKHYKAIFPIFSISQKRKEPLELIQKFFGVGKVTAFRERGHYLRYDYEVDNYKNCKIIRKFFETYPPIVKRTAFERWCKIWDFVDEKLHSLNDSEREELISMIRKINH